MCEALITREQRLWTDLNRPPFCDFRESEKLVRPEEGTLLWLLEPAIITDVTTNVFSEMEEPSDFVKDRAAKPLTGEDFASWRDSASSRCLLVTAPAGSGKSVLSNFVTTHLENRAATSRMEKIIYYFCNIRIPISERSAEAVVRALIVQLCQDQGNLIALLPPRFEQDSDAFRKAPLSELWSIMSLMMDKHPFPRVYCVIDGLDVYGDCMIGLMQKLLSLFGTSELGTLKTMKLLCTSRPERSVMETWEGYSTRQLRPNENDLRTYIATRIAKLKNLDKPMKEAARYALMKDFENPRQVERAAPTFLWISMAIRKLEQMVYPNVAEVKVEIENSSHDLDSLFENIIVKASKRARTNAVILTWIIYSRQPLTLTELQEAAAIDPSHEYTSFDELKDQRRMLSWSSVHQELGVLVDNIEGRLFVIHQSVQDFTKRTRILERWISPEPRLFLADSCMRYLLLCPAEGWWSRKHSKRVNDKIFPLRHISEDWHEYIETAKEGYERLPMIQIITGLMAYMRNFKMRILIQDRITRNISDLSTFICANNIAWMAELVLEGQIGSSRELLHDSVVTWAAEHRYELFRILMSRWQPHGPNATQALARHAADNWKGKDAMQLLLHERPDDVHVTPEIVIAAAGSGKETMQLLLQERPDEVHITPEVVVAAAGSYRSGKDVMQLLLQERPDDVRITPEVLVAAAGNHGSGKEVTQLLLQGTPNDVQITPEIVIAAARNPCCGRDVVELYSIRQQPDLSSIDEYGRTALAWALLRGNRAILDSSSKINLQINHTAPVIFRDKLGCSMIHLAAMGNCVDLLDGLPNYDKNIYAVDNQDWTALHWAAYFGHREAATILVSRGASLESRNKQGWTPFQLSLFSRSQSVAEIISSGDIISKNMAEERGEIIDGYCSSCYRDLIGYQHHCIICKPLGYDLCFRCYDDVDHLHPQHEFSDDFRY